MTSRPNRTEVRNPVLGLPAARLLQTLPAEQRLILAVLLRDLSNDARRRARINWDRRKAFLAAYWSTVAVYAGHIARLLSAGGGRRPARKPFRVVQKGFPDLAATDWADASRLYAERRDHVGLGASMYPDALLLVFDHPIGRISYNGRIWPVDDWQPGTTPLYDNRTDAQ